MNYKMSLLLCLIFIISSGTQNKTFSQCKVDECVKEIGDEYTFLKSYKIEKISDHEVEKSYVFSKDTHYMLNLCNANEVKVTLYNSDRKKIASNYDKKDDKYYNAIAYQCNSTGIYYIKFNFKNKQECCVSVLGFKK